MERSYTFYVRRPDGGKFDLTFFADTMSEAESQFRDSVGFGVQVDRVDMIEAYIITAEIGGKPVRFVVRSHSKEECVAKFKREHGTFVKILNVEG